MFQKSFTYITEIICLIILSCESFHHEKIINFSTLGENAVPKEDYTNIRTLAKRYPVKAELVSTLTFIRPIWQSGSTVISDGVVVCRSTRGLTSAPPAPRVFFHLLKAINLGNFSNPRPDYRHFLSLQANFRSTGPEARRGCRDTKLRPPLSILAFCHFCHSAHRCHCFSRNSRSGSCMQFFK